MTFIYMYSFISSCQTLETACIEVTDQFEACKWRVFVAEQAAGGDRGADYPPELVYQQTQQQGQLSGDHSSTRVQSSARAHHRSAPVAHLSCVPCVPPTSRTLYPTSGVQVYPAAPWHLAMFLRNLRPTPLYTYTQRVSTHVSLLFSDES